MLGLDQSLSSIALAVFYLFRTQYRFRIRLWKSFGSVLRTLYQFFRLKILWCVSGSGILNLVNPGPGIRDGKNGIRDKHPGSVTLVRSTVVGQKVIFNLDNFIGYTVSVRTSVIPSYQIRIQIWNAFRMRFRFRRQKNFGSDRIWIHNTNRLV